ncbi:MAG: exonuclease domain-containing protein [Candidatus Aquicultor sp.]
MDTATYVVVDLETTGLDYRTERIIEIGAVKLQGGTPVATFEHVINPNRSIPSNIVKLTGITNDMVSRGERIEDILPEFAMFAKGCVLVAHHAPFDISFLNRAARDMGLKRFTHRVFDTRLIAQKMLPLLGFYRLANLASHFNVTSTPCHRALSDAQATAEVLTHLLDSMKNAGLDTVEAASEFFYPKQRHNFGHKKSLAMALPRSSGVYIMKDKRGGVIYVGKAKDLNKRVRSYFYSSPKSERQLSFLSDISAVDHIKTGTEIGALLLESKLIKKFKPPYNVRGKRYRRYPFVHIDYEEDFPTPKIVRKVQEGGFCYGPFSNPADLELLLEVVKDLYGLRQCGYKIKAGTDRAPCFYYQVKRCSGPCAGAISQAEYHDRLVDVMNVFDGRPEGLHRELIRRRDAASQKLFFEKAALLNRSLGSLERTAKILEGIRNATATLNFLLIEDFKDTWKIYLVKEGELTSCITIANDKKGIARLERKIIKTYFSTAHHPNKITVEQVENLSLLTAYFHKRPVTRIRIGDSPDDTLQAVLPLLTAKQPAPSTGTNVGLASRPQLQFQWGSDPRLSRTKLHS